jgi:hypothetical protein
MRPTQKHMGRSLLSLALQVYPTPRSSQKTLAHVLSEKQAVPIQRRDTQSLPLLVLDRRLEGRRNKRPPRRPLPGSAIPSDCGRPVRAVGCRDPSFLAALSSSGAASVHKFLTFDDLERSRIIGFIFLAAGVQVVGRDQSPNFSAMVTRPSEFRLSGFSDLLERSRPVNFACWHISQPGCLGSWVR